MSRGIKVCNGKVIENFAVVENEYYIISIMPMVREEPQPGQFAHLKVNNLTDPLLRRPFSIFDYKDGILYFFYKITGKGTRILSQLKKGDTISLIYPLGTPFSLKENSLLVAGGTGFAPLHFLAQKLKSYKFFWGVNSITTAEKLKEYFKYLSNLQIIAFEKEGTVVDKILKERLLFKNVYACGPEEMLKSLHQNGYTGEYSLENIMACGYGVCMGCVRKIKRNNKILFLRVCKEGPVFNSEEIVWE